MKGNGLLILAVEFEEVTNRRMNWNQHVEALQRGETVQFRPKGNSMQPRIKSGQQVTVAPLNGMPQKDDIVLCKVNGTYYVHLVKAVQGEKALIGNNRGGTNGWTKNLYGIVTHVAD